MIVSKDSHETFHEDTENIHKVQSCRKYTGGPPEIKLFT